MRVTVHVKPGAKRPGIEAGEDGSLTVRVAARAVEGAANEAVERALAEHYGVSRSHVTIARGHAARTKLVDVDLP